MKRISFVCVVLAWLLVACVLTVLGQSVDRSPIAIRGRVIDGTGAVPIEDGVVLVQQDRILAVGAIDGVEIPSNAILINLPGSTVLPGFINAHVHNAFSPSLLREWVAAGVTTVRDLSLPHIDGWETWLVDSEDPARARVLWSGPMLTVPGGYPMGTRIYPPTSIESPEDARAKTSDLIAQGIDVVKIAITTSYLGPTLSLEEAQEVVSTAHTAGLRVTAHIDAEADILRALRAEVDEIAHVNVDVLSSETIAQMVASGMIMVPTLAAIERRAGPQARYNLAAFYRAGGIIALGNDAGALPDPDRGMPMDEIYALYDARMDPMDIILAATANAARACQRETDLGTLEPGKLADILVVDGNPLVDIDALNRPLVVIRNGSIIVQPDP